MQEVYIEKLVFGGQGLGRVDNKVYLVWNALPGETVAVEVTKDKKSFAEGIAREIIKPSEHRLEPREDHFLSCSPWQILAFAEENRWKTDITRETFAKIGGIDLPDDLTCTFGDLEYGYRNKIEYNFTQDEQGKLALAVFERSDSQLNPIESCELAMPVLNEAAQYLLGWLQHENVSLDILRSMILRCDQQGQVIATILCRKPWAGSTIPEIKAPLIGLSLLVWDARRYVKQRKQALYQEGATVLTDTIRGTTLSYDPSGFFQVNLPVFESAVGDMAQFITDKANVLDFYSGAGSISLPFGDMLDSGLLVDSERASFKMSEKNIKDLDLKRWSAHQAKAEEMLRMIKSDRTLIVNPPRAGLNRAVVDTIAEKHPERVLYLSCNPATQARDAALLASTYAIKFARVYNFYPHTPHIESLLVLE